MVRNVVRRLRRKLRDDAENPAYIFIEPRVGYRMAMGLSRSWHDRGRLAPCR